MSFKGIELPEGRVMELYKLEVPSEYDLAAVEKVIDGIIPLVPGGMVYRHNGDLQIRSISPNDELGIVETTLTRTFPGLRLELIPEA